MIGKMSKKIAYSLCKCIGNMAMQELYQYAIYITISSLLHCCTILLVGLLYNLVLESALFYASFILIRKFAGGFHANTHVKCYLISTITSIIVLGIIKIITLNTTNDILFSTLFLAFISMLFIWYLAPIDSDNNSLNTKEKNIYKIISIVTSLFIFILCVYFSFNKNYNIYISLVFGLFISFLVLIIRKIEIIVEQKQRIS